MTRPRRHQQMPITAAPDIRAASKVNSTGPIPGADRVDPETDPHDTDAATDPSPEEATTAEAGPSADSLDEDDPSGESGDRKSTRLNSSHVAISYAVFCLKKKTKLHITHV